MLTRFWLSRASAPLTPRRSVTWEFMVAGAIAETHVRDMVRDQRIVLGWDGDERAGLKFEQRADGVYAGRDRERHHRQDLRSSARMTFVGRGPA